MVIPLTGRTKNPQKPATPPPSRKTMAHGVRARFPVCATAASTTPGSITERNGTASPARSSRSRSRSVHAIQLSVSSAGMERPKNKDTGRHSPGATVQASVNHPAGRRPRRVPEGKVRLAATISLPPFPRPATASFPNQALLHWPEGLRPERDQLHLVPIEDGLAPTVGALIASPLVEGGALSLKTEPRMGIDEDEPQRRGTGGCSGIRRPCRSRRPENQSGLASIWP
jgi:hypothetical protein